MGSLPSCRRSHVSGRLRWQEIFAKNELEDLDISFAFFVLAGHGTKWIRNANIRAKMTKMHLLCQIWSFWGQNPNFLEREQTHISESQLCTSFPFVFCRISTKMDQKGKNLAQNNQEYQFSILHLRIHCATFRFRETAVFVKKERPKRQKVFPHPTVGARSASSEGEGWKIFFFLQIFGKASADNQEPCNFTGPGPGLDYKVSANSATSGPKTSEFQSGHKVINDIILFNDSIQCDLEHTIVVSKKLHFCNFLPITLK